MTVRSTNDSVAKPGYRATLRRWRSLVRVQPGSREQCTAPSQRLAVNRPYER